MAEICLFVCVCVEWKIKEETRKKHVHAFPTFLFTNKIVREGGRNLHVYLCVESALSTWKCGNFDYLKLYYSAHNVIHFLFLCHTRDKMSVLTEMSYTYTHDTWFQWDQSPVRKVNIFFLMQGEKDPFEFEWQWLQTVKHTSF